MYNEVKKDFGALKILSKPAGADVYINESRASSGQTPLVLGIRAGEVKVKVQRGGKKKEDTILVIAAKETVSPEYVLKRGSSMLYILGGLAVAGGVGLAVLLGGGKSESNGSAGPVATNGTIQVNSEPTGATIILDGENTGLVTNNTLVDISPGDHTILLQKENYVDYEETVSVTAGQTASVNATLETESINVDKPNNESVWKKGRLERIEWATASTNQGHNKYKQLLRSTANRHISSYIQRRALRFRSSSSSRGMRRSQRMTSSRNGSTVSGRSPKLFSRDGTSNTESYAGLKGLPMNLRHPLLDRFNPLMSPAPSLAQQPAQKNRTAGTADPLLISNVRIELYRYGDEEKTIAQETTNDGVHSWQVDSDLDKGWGYTVKVFSSTDSEMYGESEEFEIIGVSDFDEYFDDASFVNNYMQETYTDLWRVEDGVYLTVGQAGLNKRHTSHYTRQSYSNFIMTADCGNEDSDVFYGLGFRGNTDFTSFYFFYVGTDGSYAVRFRDGNSESSVIDFTYHDAIRTGHNQWNALRVEGYGKDFIFFINDVEVDSVYIPGAPNNGRIGLVTRTNYLNVWFDDFSVRVPE
jgi:hypothetical protein